MLTSEARARANAAAFGEAATIYAEALSLWRGRALSGIELESVGRHELEQLEEGRITALMDRIDCELALGRHDDLVGELEVLLAEHPLRERLYAQQMLALYRSGRQADALRVYQRARAVLVEELGLEPSPGLQRLERGILNHDPSLQTPSGTAHRNGHRVSSRPRRVRGEDPAASEAAAGASRRSRARVGGGAGDSGPGGSRIGAVGDRHGRRRRRARRRLEERRPRVANRAPPTPDRDGERRRAALAGRLGRNAHACDAGFPRDRDLHSEVRSAESQSETGRSGPPTRTPARSSASTPRRWKSSTGSGSVTGRARSPSTPSREHSGSSTAPTGPSPGSTARETR